MKYFRCLYRLRREEWYLIWISNERDAVVVDDAGLVPVFKDAKAVQVYADRNGYKLEGEEAILHDLDWVAAWVDEPQMPINCNEALAAWNLFSDVARSVHERETAFEPLDSGFPTVYNKLFWGSNLPSLTPTGRHYDPEWLPEERRALAQVLGTGLEMFRSFTGSLQQKA
jgi:hypothetical protein